MTAAPAEDLPAHPAMIAPSRGLRLAAGALAVLALTCATGAAWVVWRLGPVAAGYAAKTVCSGVFVSGREAQQVFDIDVVADNHPLLRLTRVRVDEGAHRVHATFLGTHRRSAGHVPDAGCTLDLHAGGPQAHVARPQHLPAGGQTLSTPLPRAPDPTVQAVLDRALADSGPRTRALVVMHHGRILAQAYAPGIGPDMPLPGWSMSKTVTALLAGTVVRAQRLHLAQAALLPRWAGDARRGITLDHLLRMTDGLAFDERSGDPFSDVVRMLLDVPDAAGFAADKPLHATPGSAWRYSSGTTNILMRVIAQASGRAPADFAALPRDALFDPLGMRTATIEPDGAGLPIGSSYMYASAHDWMRLGQLLLDDGVWRGKRLVPEGWVRYMATPTPLAGARHFGAHLWLAVPAQYQGEASTRTALPADAFHAVGHEGQLLSVIPSQAVVVLRLGLTRAPHRWDHQHFLARVLAALPQDASAAPAR